MKSIPPPDTDDLDSLWEALEGGPFSDLPPALRPSSASHQAVGAPSSVGAGRKTPTQPSEPPPERDTLVPPMPTEEYVQKMMQLGEIDDPLAPSNRQPQGFGLKLASESDMLEGHEPPVSPPPAFDGGFAARVAARRPPPAPLASPGTPSAGLRAVLGPRTKGASGPSNPNLPVPRAPSIPPLAEGGLDALDALDNLGALPFSPVSSPAPARPEPAAPSPRPRPGPMRRSPSSGGFRLGKPVAMGETPKPPAQPAPSAETSERTTTGIVPVKRPPPPEEPAPESAPPSSALERAGEMQSLFEARNYMGALVIAESILVSAPSHPQALRCAESCREMLAQKYLERLGGRTAIPQVVVGPEEIRWLALDHRGGFLVSSIDGTSTIEELLDVCSMPELDALRILFELKEQGAIELREPMRRKR